MKKVSVDVEPKDLSQVLDKLFTVKLCDVMQITYGLWGLVSSSIRQVVVYIKYNRVYEIAEYMEILNSFLWYYF